MKIVAPPRVPLTDANASIAHMADNPDVIASKAKGILVTVASGAATAFCWAQYVRAGRDEAKIKELFKHRTTIRDLEAMLEAGKPLPPLAVICGQLRADAPMPGWRDMAIKQYLLTRLAPTVFGPGKRVPKDTRYTVATSRLEAPGLHLRGLSGGEATVRLPRLQADMGHNSPCLFLSQTDAFQEFMTSTELRKKLTELAEFRDLGQTPLAHTGKRFTHTSKFVSSDVEPPGDLPSGFLHECHAKLSNLEHGDEDTLKHETSWFWNPRGFYDCEKDGEAPSWSSFSRCEFVRASEFLRRAELAAEENNEESPMRSPAQSLAQLRDVEFGYRFVELAIPVDQDVTVVARPVAVEDATAQRRVQLTEPLKEADAPNFRFRVLKGHSVDRLLEHRALRKQKWKRYINVSAALTAASALYTVFC